MTELLKCTFVGDRESIPRQIDKKSGLPKEEKCVWIFEEERLLEFSRRRKGQTCLFALLFVFLYIP